MRTGETRKCAVCGKDFYRRPSQIQQRASAWCSRECSYTGRRRGEERSCQGCGKVLYAYPSTRKGRECRSCYLKNSIGQSLKGRPKSAETRAKLSANRANRPTGAKHHGWKGGAITRACLQCHKPYIIETSRAHKDRIRFCGRACWYEWCREDPTRTPNWRGGYEPYYGPNWPRQSRDARRRDQFTCQACGDTKSKWTLEVHHIQAFRTFQGDWKSANRLSNLVTLCKSCHAKDSGHAPNFAFRLALHHID